MLILRDETNFKSPSGVHDSYRDRGEKTDVKTFYIPPQAPKGDV